MKLQNINSNKSGFTIVELLIVIVVIAILAAITIVAYNGITARANSSAARTAASNTAKKLEVYLADETTASTYPKGSDAASTALTGSANSSKTYYISGVTIGNANPGNNDAGKTTLRYVTCGIAASGNNAAPTVLSGGTAATTLSTVTGAVLHWYDFTNNRVTTTSTDPASLSVGQVSGSNGSQAIGCVAAAS